MMETLELINKMVDQSKDPYLKVCTYQHCGKEFKAKRLNQFYCCFECKTKTNNLKAKEKRDATKDTYNTLMRNREILKAYYKRGKVNVSLNELQDAGFKYNFHTHRKKEAELGIMVPFYFEFGLIPENDQSLNSFTICKQS